LDDVLQVLERLARFEQQLKQPKEGEDWKTHRLRFEEDDSEKNVLFSSLQHSLTKYKHKLKTIH
jgi:hypothetical protein